MTEVQRAWLKRIFMGGIVGGGPLLLLCGLFNTAAWGGAISLQGRPFTLVNLKMQEAFGTSALAGFLVVGLSFAIGAAVGVGTLPFAETGRALARRSALHAAVTGALLLALGRVCFWYDGPAGGVLLFGIYVFFYLVVWLVRWLGWRAELDQLRAALDLPLPPPSPHRWRESLPYAALLAGLFLALRPLLWPLEGADVPVLTGLLLPFLGYPAVALATGLGAGRALGVCPLVPAAALLAFLPNLLYSAVPYSVGQGLVYAALALGGNLLGTAWGKMRTRRERRVWDEREG